MGDLMQQFGLTRSTVKTYVSQCVKHDKTLCKEKGGWVCS